MDWLRKRVVILSLALLGFPFVAGAQLTRVANSSLNLPANLASGTYSTVNAFPGLIFTDPVAIVSAPGESNRLFIVEQIGRISVIPDLSSPSRLTFLDISSQVRSSGNEEGLLGLAFHPNYNRAGYPGFGSFFVFYQITVSNNRHWRLSRFNVNSGNPNQADAGSEVPLITQRDRAGNHNGGDIHFGNDGYLYIAVGDEGGANDTYDNGQHIDKDFFSAILRIDVDSNPSNLVPNNHSAVHAGTYRVPADNPFVGASAFNGAAVNPSNVRTEIWAIGLRNPWRMSLDRVTGRWFVADVGQGAREEINIMSPAVFAGNGGVPNYGWSYREGFLAFTNGPGGSNPPAGFSHIDPIHDYPRSLGRSVTGGIVYRGANYPELTGDYLFADYLTGRIWAMDDPGGPNQAVVQIATDNQIAGFGIDPATGDILLADDNSNRQNDDQIKRLVRTPGSGNAPPQFLSQTGAFSSLATLSPESGIVSYDINLPFWSDHAVKTRWFSIPNVNDDMTWQGDDAWSFPAGQVWIKHFELDLDRDNPGTNRRRIETRFLIKTTDDVYGLTYRWNTAQTDAELVSENGMTEDFSITEDGQSITQTWKYPSRADCRACHNETAGFALGFNTRQLNRDFTHGSATENQIDSLAAAGYFTNTPPQGNTLPEFYRADDQTASLEERARSFLAVNCVQCHQPGGPALGTWNARPELPLISTGIIDGELVNNGGNPFNRVFVPGSPGHSMLIQRLAAVEGNTGLAPMPPLASCVTNDEAIDLLSDWAASIQKILFVRGGDRTGGFLEGNNDAERTEHLADINNLTAGAGNHGWGELAATLRNQGFIVEQITEGSETSSGPAQGIHIDFETLNLDQYRVIVFGSNNANYDGAAIDAIDNWIRGGGSALFISDANFGGNWADAANSDQYFLDRFGLIMNQDQGTYVKSRSAGEFLVPGHPIFNGVDDFDGEGVSPISIGNLPGDVQAVRLAAAEGNVRRNNPPYGSSQGPSTANDANDAALLAVTAAQGKIAGHFDRNTFFNQEGAGTDLTRFDNETYALNLFTWLATDSNVVENITATDGDHLDRVALNWDALAGTDSYRVYRSESAAFATASLIHSGTATAFDDTGAEVGIGYFYWVTAIGGGEETPPSAPESGYRAVPIPTNLTASDGASSDHVEISWNTVTGPASYRVYRGETNQFSSAQLVGDNVNTPWQDNSGIPERIYFYWVTATINGRESENGTADSGHRFLASPTNVTATDNTAWNHVAVTWTGSGGATQYRVFRHTADDFSGAVLLGSTSGAEFFDDSANPGVDYFYWVVAANGYGSSSQSSSDAGLRAHPPRPDFRVGRNGQVPKGQNIYGGISNQKVSITKRRRRTITGFARLENDGGLAEILRFSGSKGNRFLRVRYHRLVPNRANVTGAVTSSNYSRFIAAGGFEQYRIRIIPTSRLKKLQAMRRRVFRFRGQSSLDTSRVDQAAIDAKSRK